MKIIIKTKNLDLTDELEGFINEKVGYLQKFISTLRNEDKIGKTLAEVFVEVERETEHHKKGQIFSCQIEITLPKKNLVIESNSDDIKKAIVIAKKEMEQEIKKYKFKKIDKIRRGRRKDKEEINL